MSGKPQEAREGDLLEQIITQGLEKVNAPARTADAGTASPEEADPAPERREADPSPSERKNRRTSVYLYLLVLFGAAFLMLLLAYFVQQRNSEDALSDLRDSMNLSREQLLDQISALEEQNAELEAQNNTLSGEISRLRGDLAQLQERYEEQVQSANNTSEQYTDALARLYGWESYWLLEQSYQAGKYEDCVAILILMHMTEYGSTLPPEAADRYVEIIQSLADLGLLQRDQPINISDHQELIDRFLAEHPDFGPRAGVLYG